MRLGNQDSIKWIAMNRRQRIDRHRMFAGDGQLTVAIVEQSATQNTRINLEVIPPKSALYGDLPKAGSTEHPLVFRIFKQRPRFARQALPLLTAEGDCPAATSSRVTEQLLNVRRTHPIEIVGYLDLPDEKTKSTHLLRHRCIHVTDRLNRATR